MHLRHVASGLARRGLRCRSKRITRELDVGKDARGPYADESSDIATVSPRSSIPTARSGAGPERISIFASGSVYGPDVSYTTSGGFFPGRRMPAYRSARSGASGADVGARALDIDLARVRQRLERPPRRPMRVAGEKLVGRVHELLCNAADARGERRTKHASLHRHYPCTGTKGLISPFRLAERTLASMNNLRYSSDSGARLRPHASRTRGAKVDHCKVESVSKAGRVLGLAASTWNFRALHGPARSLSLKEAPRISGRRLDCLPEGSRSRLVAKAALA